jgi:hypothetical protein
MKWPEISKIKDWKKSGRLRLKDEKFWEGDNKQNDFWLSIVIDRLEKENAKKTKS